MTQKELLYYEDAIGHEGNIITILKDSIERIESEELRTFLESEVEIHQNLKTNLIQKLEDEANE
ncbi:MAG: hypothetical protein IKN63_04425 [Bacilli bacterium]|nr:hypothetical protein [Bacilli bacterium]